MPVTVNEVREFALRCSRETNDYSGGSDNISNVMKKQYSDLEEMTDRAGNGVQVGKYLSFPAADGSALYLIEKVNKTSVKVLHLDICDGYSSYAVSPNGTVNIGTATQVIAHKDNLKKYFKSKGN